MWQIAFAFLMGMGVSEYYNRFRIDRIRREQLEELRCRKQQAAPRGGVHREPPRDWAPPPMPQARRAAAADLISDEQFDELRSTGRTGGKRMHEVE